MKNAVIAGRLFYEAKKMKIFNKSYMANASSPKKIFEKCAKVDQKLCFAKWQII